MVRAMRVYQDAGVRRHHDAGPRRPGSGRSSGGETYMAFVYGYINALIKAAELMA